MVGTTISPYKVIEKIGQGGMGESYLAEDSCLQGWSRLAIGNHHPPKAPPPFR